MPTDHRWALDVVVRELDWCPWRGRWVVVRKRTYPANPGERCWCRGACAYG